MKKARNIIMSAAIIIAFIVLLVVFAPEKKSYNESWDGTTAIATMDLIVKDKPSGKIIGLIDQGDSVKLTGNITELRFVKTEDNRRLCEIWYNKDEHITAWVNVSGIKVE